MSKRRSVLMPAASLVLVLLTLPVVMMACGKGSDSAPSSDTPAQSLPPVDAPGDDGLVVHARAIVTVTSEQQTAMLRLFKGLFMADAYAVSDGTTTVTYTNGASTTYTVSTASFAPGSITGTTLSLGSFTISSLSDNNLKVCGSSNNNSKCGTGVLRVYTTGTVSGFVNTTDGTYGAPVYAGTLNPTSQVGLTATNAVNVATYSIPNNVHVLNLASAFPSPTYSVTSDFSNAGAGSYSMTFVMEYALSP